MAVDRKDLGESIGGVNKAGKEDKTEELLRGPLLKPVETQRMSIDMLDKTRKDKAGKTPCTGRLHTS